MRGGGDSSRILRYDTEYFPASYILKLGNYVATHLLLSVEAYFLLL